MIRHAFNRVEEESSIGVCGLSVVFEKFRTITKDVRTVVGRVV